MVTSSRKAVFLRGINVGRAKRIAMGELAALVETLGATDVRTLLNSGNVVCTSTSGDDELATAVSEGIARTFGFTVDVVVRSREEIDAVLARDPWGAVATTPSRYLVFFLGGEPSREAVEKLAVADLGDDVWVVHGRELYAWIPPGVADSPLAKQLAKGVLGVTWTGRNWTTVTRVRDLL